MRAFLLDGLKYLQGEPVSVASEGNSVIVLERWATWCPPCLRSIPHLNTIFQKYQGRGLVVVGVSNEKEQVIAKYLDQMGDKMSYGVAVDSDGVTNAYMKAYHCTGIPSAFIINHKRDIVFDGHPMSAEFEQAVVNALDAMDADTKN